MTPTEVDRRRGLAALRLGALVVGTVLTARLYQIQFVHGAELRTQADANRYVERDIEVDRGVIYDAAGRQVVLNKPRFTVGIVTAALPRDATDLDRVLRRVAEATGLPLKRGDRGQPIPPPADARGLEARASTQTEQRPLMDRLPRENGRLVRTWQKVPVARSVSRTAAFRLLEEGWELPGVVGGEAPVREYTAGPTLAHILGFTASIPAEELEDYLARGYAIYDVVGRSGLEATYEDWLRGSKGQKLIEVDATGRELRTVGRQRPPVPGHSLVLTVDLEFQRAVESILDAALVREGARSGAVVVIDPRDGAVRSLVSLPNFDNNLFSAGATPEEFAAILTNDRRPLLNRAISGQYPPGSTFKIVTAAAALQEGVVRRNTRIVDPGVIVLPNQYNPDITYPFYCWLRSGHGALNIVGALAQSCDVYFYEVSGGYHENGANQPGLGSEVLARYARAFGLGTKTGVELLGEAPGRVPTAAWLDEALELPWTTGETYNLGIGQSYLLVTPLQMAVATAAVANGGTVFRPHLVDRILDASGTVVKRPGGVVRQLPVSPEILATIREGMRGAVLYGTARPEWSRLPSQPPVAGKTGTAEFNDPVFTEYGVFPRYDRNGNLLTHAWFVAYAPADDPEVAVAVFVDGSGLDHIIEGSRVAAPIAGDVFRAYFRLPTPTPAPCSDCSSETNPTEGEEAPTP